MTPNVDERLASIVRSLTEVVMPHLPSDASLAQEQVQLAIGHIQIIRSQLDQVPDFEQEELDDYRELAAALRDAASGGSKTSAARDAIDAALANASGLGVRDQRVAVNKAVEQLVDALPADGASGAQAKVAQMIVDHAERRTLKDREWFVPFGFDTL